MAVSKPTGITCRHQPGWAYLTVPSKRGDEQVVQYQDRGTWSVAAYVSGEWLVPMHQVGQTEFRARYERAGGHSAWTTGRVWMPTGFEVDDQPAPKPETPYRLRNQWPTTGQVNLSWSQEGQVDGWHVAVTQVGLPHFDEVVIEPYVEVTGLAYDQSVEVVVRAVVGQTESLPLVQDYPSMHYRPTTPRDLIVGSSERALALEWTQDDICEEWQVLWRPAEQGLLRSPEQIPLGTRGESGNITVSGDPEYIIGGLSPDTEYSILIAAQWRRTSYSPESLTGTYTTSGGGTGPRKPLLRKGRVTESSIEVLWDDDPAATGWVVRRRPGHSRHKPTGQPRWLAEGLAPETSYEFGVVAVDDDHGLESEEATIAIATTGDVPPPPVVPSVPTGLRVHCIHAMHAKAEWDEAGPEEDVTHYQVRLTGASAAENDRVIGTLQELTDLIPESDYTVAVRACNSGGCSAWTSAQFTTASSEPPPDPDPPSDLAKPSGLYLDPVAPGIVEATWNRPADTRVWWLISVDGLVRQQRVTQPRARLDVTPGAEATVEVYALLNGGQGEPTKLSPVASAGVVTARKGA